MSFIERTLRSYRQLRAEIRRNSGYLARQELERLKAELSGQPARLEHHGFKVYSQSDEDGIIEEIFRRIGMQQGAFCEIGVENGLECNSLYLLHKGWRGSWLEGNVEQKRAIEGKFKSLLAGRRLSLGIGMVAPETVNDDIATAFARIGLDPDRMDFLSIDIDGMDIYLLEALRFTPKVLCVEYNAKFPAGLSKRPVFDPSYSYRGTDYMGSSLSALNEAATRKGYVLVGTNFVGVNAFFVRADLVSGRFQGPFTPQALYNPPRYYLLHDHYAQGVGHPADFGPYVDLT
jgi:hypothetical protein